MSTGNNLEEIYSNSIKILKDLIAFKTVSGENNTQLIDYCDNILNSLSAVSFRTYDEEEKRVNLFSTIKAKKKSKKKNQ
jgi:acetylornithine deacetylase